MWNVVKESRYKYIYKNENVTKQVLLDYSIVKQEILPLPSQDLAVMFEKPKQFI